MQVNSGIGLRESLEQLETAKLDELLSMELEKEAPDADAVRLILSILEQRDKTQPKQITPRQEAAWERYRQRMKGLEKKQVSLRPWFTAAASLLVVLGLLFAVVPQQAQAETFWQMLQRISESVISFFSEDGKKADVEYIFETDNAGLQQIYDTVVEWGIDGPMVPMWLLDGCELSNLKIITSPMSQGLGAEFLHNGQIIMLKLDVYEGKPAHQYYKDDSYEDSFEKNGIAFNITKNHDIWVAVWTKDNIECSLALDCQEDTLRRILESIYVTED